MSTRLRAFSRAIVSALGLTVALGCSAATVRRGAPPAQSPPPDAADEVTIQILALNDFHGHLEPPKGSSGRVGTVEAGGAAYLATHVEDLRQRNANTVVVSAGDLIGASPLVSALLHDEPTIEAMNLIGLDLHAVGNHEFDEGRAELLRMQDGGCHPSDGCQDGSGFDGAEFAFLAANVVDRETGETLFPPYAIRELDGVHVAFVGMTLEGTPNVATASAVAGLDFRDEADTVNALVPVLRRQGVEAIVVVVHEGGSPTALDVRGCADVTGPIVDVVTRMDPAIDLVISGHTHQPYSCVIAGRPVTSAYSFGRVLSVIDVRVSRATKDVTSVQVDNRIVTRHVAADERIARLIGRASVVTAPIANRRIGTLSVPAGCDPAASPGCADISRAADDSREQAMGNVIADAQLAATADPGLGGAVIAFMNPGGVRAELAYPGGSAGEGDGVLTHGELFSVQPFGNVLVTMTLTGAQIDLLLEQQFCGLNAAANGHNVLLPSAGFYYVWDESEAAAATTCGTRDVVPFDSITLRGAPLDPAASYRVTVNSFLADGGDGFPAFETGTDRLAGALDTDAFEAYLRAAEPRGIVAAPRDRIDVQP